MKHPLGSRKHLLSRFTVRLLVPLALTVMAFGLARKADSQVAPYNFVDLGTLGGTRCEPKTVNDRGQVAGVSTTRDGTWRAFRITPVDTNADGKPDVWNRDLNNDGANDLMQALPHPKGSWKGSRAQAINNNGQVCGEMWSGRGIPDITAVTWSGASAGTGTLLGKAGDGSIALGINDAGQIVGSRQGAVNFAATLWQLSKGSYTATTLPLPAGFAGGRATSINNYGQIAGSLADPSTALEAFRWTSQGGTQALGRVPGQGGVSWDLVFINDQGEVAITAIVGDFPRATLWLPGAAYGVASGIHDLGLPSVDSYSSWASGFNNLGQVNCWVENFDGSMGSFLWQDAAWRDFASLAALPPGVTLGNPGRPSNNGYLTGTSSTDSEAGRLSGYLLTPN